MPSGSYRTRCWSKTLPPSHSPGLWDSVAASYDGRRPDQGLTHPPTRAAWQRLTRRWLPPSPSRILDLGSGTGSLSLLLAADGHEVTGIDFSPAMVAQARAKAVASGSPAQFVVADATSPDFEPGSIDAIVCRQTLWALPDRPLALRNWARLLRAGGTLLLIEGLFASGNGMSEAEIVAALPPSLSPPQVIDLAADHELWGGPIPDQRLLVVSTRLPSSERSAQ